MGVDSYNFPGGFLKQVALTSDSAKQVNDQAFLYVRLWYKRWAIYVDQVKMSTFDKTTMYTYLQKDRILVIGKNIRISQLTTLKR